MKYNEIEIDIEKLERLEQIEQAAKATFEFFILYENTFYYDPELHMEMLKERLKCSIKLGTALDDPRVKELKDGS